MRRPNGGPGALDGHAPFINGPLIMAVGQEPLRQKPAEVQKEMGDDRLPIGLVVGRLASRSLHAFARQASADIHPHVDCGDNVVIVTAAR